MPEAWEVRILQPRWVIDELPRDAESALDVCAERFHAKCLGRVMSGVNQIHPKFLRGNVGPVRTLASEKRIHPTGSRLCHLATGPARDDTQSTHPVRTARCQPHRGTDRLLDAIHQCMKRSVDRTADADFQEWGRLPHAESLRQ